MGVLTSLVRFLLLKRTFFSLVLNDCLATDSLKSILVLVRRFGPQVFTVVVIFRLIRCTVVIFIVIILLGTVKFISIIIKVILLIIITIFLLVIVSLLILVQLFLLFTIFAYIWSLIIFLTV